MEHARIEPGQSYLCLYGRTRYRATALEKTGAVVLVRLDEKLDEDGRAVGLPEAAEIGTEIWLAPEAIEPVPAAASNSKI